MQKERVEILGAEGIKKKKKYPVKEGRIIIEKEKRRGSKVPAWQPTFKETDFLYERKRFGLFFHVLTRKLLVKEFADSCISLRTRAVTIPKMDVQKLFDKSVLKNAGDVSKKVQVPALLYLLVAMVLVVNLIMFVLFNQRFNLV